MLKIILPVSILLSAQFALAAIPPMTKEMRESRATHIIEGKVLSVDKELVDARGEDKQFKDWDMTAQVEVSRFLKSENYGEMGAETIKVKYWKPAKRPKGWTGSQGQNAWMSAGDDVCLFMMRDAETDSYNLLIPNGWESLSETQSNFMEDRDDLDDVEWYDLEDQAEVPEYEIEE